jgi:hypothetical protein
MDRHKDFPPNTAVVLDGKFVCYQREFSVTNFIPPVQQC